MTNIGRDTATGSSLLALTPLITSPKANGTIRPIAISGIIYRFAMKVIVCGSDAGSSLLRYQFRVDTKEEWKLSFTPSTSPSTARS
jgi:hypothetical protein